MAFYGLSKPYVAKLLPTGKYEAGMYLGEAITTEVNPNYAEVSLYGDNGQVENVREFTNADVNVGTTKIPATAGALIFGHTLDSSKNEETSNANDSAAEVGYGFVVKNIENGITSYKGCVLYRVKFAEGSESYETKGENIVFKTPSISGKAMPLANGDWRKKSEAFTTEADAEAWIRDQFPTT